MNSTNETMNRHYSLRSNPKVIKEFLAMLDFEDDILYQLFVAANTPGSKVRKIQAVRAILMPITPTNMATLPKSVLFVEAVNGY